MAKAVTWGETVAVEYDKRGGNEGRKGKKKGKDPERGNGGMLGSCEEIDGGGDGQGKGKKCEADDHVTYGVGCDDYGEVALEEECGGNEGGAGTKLHGILRSGEEEGECRQGSSTRRPEAWEADPRWHRARGGWTGRFEATAVSAGIMCVYWMTMPRTITGGDSGEVMAAACSWGPAHPPGYPLFVALAQLAMWAFRGLGDNTAFRVNIMSALLTAGAVYNLHRAIRAISRGSASAALLGAGMYGLSPLIWNNAMQAEVFALNNLFVCLLTNVAVKYFSREEREDASLAYLGAFLSGLALTNQHTIVLYLAAIIPAVLWSGSSQLLRPLPFLALSLLFTVGITPYTHMWLIRGCPMPWAEEGQVIMGTKYCPLLEHVPRYSWGDSRSFQGFVNHLLRRDYGTLSLAAGGTAAHGKPVSLLTGLLYYLLDAAGPRLDERVVKRSTVSHDGQLLYFGVPFAILGAYLFLRGGRAMGPHVLAGRTLSAAYLVYLVIFHSLANLPIRVALFRAVHARFWQLPNSTLFLFLGVGFARATRRFPLILRWLLAGAGVYVQCLHNWASEDQSQTRAVEILTRTALESAPANAIIVCSGDLQLNPSVYMQACEGLRPDVTVLSLQLMSYRWYTHNASIRHPGVHFPGRSHWPDAEGYSLQSFLLANIDQRPVMAYGGNRPAETLEKLLEDASLNEEQFYHVPYGLLDRIVRTEELRPNIHWMARDFATAIAPVERWARGGGLPDLGRFGEDTWEEQVAREYFLAIYRFGFSAAEHYKTLPGDDCAGECPGGCDCERTMALTRELVRHAFGSLHEAAMTYSARGLAVPFNWDGAVDQHLGDLYEEEENAVMALWHWSRYLVRKHETDIMRTVISRKVAALRHQATGTAPYDFPFDA